MSLVLKILHFSTTFFIAPFKRLETSFYRDCLPFFEHVVSEDYYIFTYVLVTLVQNLV